MSKTRQRVDAFARDLDNEVQEAVHGGSKATSEKRYATLAGDYPDPDLLRRTAGLIKQHTLDHLDRYLEQAVMALEDNGAKVHFALDAVECNNTVLRILREHRVTKLVKSKSMLSEEVHLPSFLRENGIESVETDLGEFIVQIDADHPSHIVKPIIHKNRSQIARSFEREGLGDYNEDPQTITRRARAHLRRKYMEAGAGMTGANFVSAESGRIVIVTNEGNARFGIAATPVHIVLVGIEKLLPRDRDLSLFLALIGRSATGQQLTVYTQFINGAKGPLQPDGPEALHVVFVDNRRSEVLASNCREILRCIRCGACLNVCPVYRQASGHAYRAVYPGPVGAVLSPLLAGTRFPELADLPKASSLCGACNEVCPVDIPIPDLLLRLRDRGKREGARAATAGTPPMGAWALLCRQPAAWSAALKLGKALDHTPKSLIPVPALHAWCGTRQLPPWQGGVFRKWMRENKKSSQPDGAPTSAS